MSKFGLTFENAWQDLVSSDGRISIATQTTLLFFLITLTLASASIQQYLAGNLDQMLGSDVVIESHTDLTPALETELAGLASGISKTTLTSATLTHDGEWARVQLKQVDNAYPCRAHFKLEIRPHPRSAGRPMGR